MARVKLTEHAAKSLLTDGYTGIAIALSTRDEDIARLDANHHYIIKVDQGIKKRGKQGLIRLDVTKETAKQAIEELAAKGYARFIAEEMVPHAAGDEQYLSIERLRSFFGNIKSYETLFASFFDALIDLDDVVVICIKSRNILVTCAECNRNPCIAVRQK
jgi:hypothetical protein